MPAIRPILEYKYQHRQFRHKLKPPYGRSCPPRFGPKFKPTRPIYDEQEPEKIRSILLQRRRVDGKTMLSDVRTIQRGLDTSGVYTNEQIRDKLIPLLDHKNLVRLMDIQFEEIEEIHMAYPGFEDMTRGTLNRILFEKVAIPESLCWHVLEGVTNALLWLHYGLDNTHVEDDWNPIALINIHPGAIYFTAPRDDETYGLAKVGNFDNAIVMPKGQNPYDTIRVPHHARDELGCYVAPEVVYTQGTAALVSDIYSLGATLYHMMVGQPPQEVDLSHETTTHPAGRDAWVTALPPDTTYSPQLKRIVREMLRTRRRHRPDAAQLYQNIVDDMEVWQKESVEGRRYIRRKEEEVVLVDEDKEGNWGEDREKEGSNVVVEAEGGREVIVGGEESGTDDDEEEEHEQARGKGKTRGGGQTRVGEEQEQEEEEDEEEEEGELEQARGKGKTRGGGKTRPIYKY